MSTFFATFSDWAQAKSVTQELINGGVSPDDLSLLLSHKGWGESGEMKEYVGSVGDATSYVGAKDDPSRAHLQAPHEDINAFTSTGSSRVSPVDTSNRDTDVESVDQMEDSQNEAEFMISPRDGISNSSHEKDDLALTVLTGFPTASSNFSGPESDPFEQGVQNSEGLEIIEIPNVVLVVGGGALATAALDFDEASIGSIVAQLTDVGVPEENAQNYKKLFLEGQALLAVEVTPGILNEQAVEDIATRHGGLNAELYDAPRY